jgi:hypothetical protein
VAKEKTKQEFKNCFECKHEKDGICLVKYNDLYPNNLYHKAVEKILCDSMFKERGV